MKFLIWFGCFLVFVSVKVLFLRNYLFGALPAMLYWGAMFLIAYLLCNAWNKRKVKNKGIEQSNDNNEIQ